MVTCQCDVVDTFGRFNHPPEVKAGGPIGLVTIDSPSLAPKQRYKKKTEEKKT